MKGRWCTERGKAAKEKRLDMLACGYHHELTDASSSGTETKGILQIVAQLVLKKTSAYPVIIFWYNLTSKDIMVQLLSSGDSCKNGNSRW